MTAKNAESNITVTPISPQDVPTRASYGKWSSLINDLRPGQAVKIELPYDFQVVSCSTCLYAAAKKANRSIKVSRRRNVIYVECLKFINEKKR